MPVKQDWGAVGAGLEQGVRNLLGQLIDGTIADLDGPIRQTAQQLALAARRQRQDLVDEARDTLALIVMEKEKRVKDAATGGFDLFLGMGLNALTNGAIAGLAGLKAY